MIEYGAAPFGAYSAEPRVSINLGTIYGVLDAAFDTISNAAIVWTLDSFADDPWNDDDFDDSIWTPSEQNGGNWTIG